jgi:hypothetical protein
MQKLSFFEIVSLIRDIQEVLSELQADGALEKLEAAVSTVGHEMHNPKVAALLGKLKAMAHSLAPHKDAPHT